MHMASLNTHKIRQTLHAMHVNVDMSKAYIVSTCITLAVDVFSCLTAWRLHVL